MCIRDRPCQGIRGSIFLCADTACCYAFVCAIGCESRRSEDEGQCRCGLWHSGYICWCILCVCSIHFRCLLYTSISSLVTAGSNNLAQAAQEIAEGATDQSAAIEELQATFADITDGVEKTSEKLNDCLLYTSA